MWASFLLFGRLWKAVRWRQGLGLPSGMTSEHHRPLLDEVRSVHLLFQLGENLGGSHVCG